MCACEHQRGWECVRLGCARCSRAHRYCPGCPPCGPPSSMWTPWPPRGLPVPPVDPCPPCGPQPPCGPLSLWRCRCHGAGSLGWAALLAAISLLVEDAATWLRPMRFSLGRTPGSAAGEPGLLSEAWGLGGRQGPCLICVRALPLFSAGTAGARDPCSPHCRRPAHGGCSRGMAISGTQVDLEPTRAVPASSKAGGSVQSGR